MEYSALLEFLRSICPPHVEVMRGDDNILCASDHKANSQAYIKYSEGLDFSFQGVRNGEKTDTRVFSFKNEHEAIQIISAMVLELLDGERRV